VIVLKTMVEVARQVVIDDVLRRLHHVVPEVGCHALKAVAGPDSRTRDDAIPMFRDAKNAFCPGGVTLGNAHSMTNADFCTSRETSMVF
jgi:hypothetical protein